MLNFSTYRCNYCGGVGGSCRKPECLMLAKQEDENTRKLLENTYQEKVKIGQQFTEYSFEEGSRKIVAEYELKEIKEDSKKIDDKVIVVKGIFKKVGTTEEYLKVIHITLDGCYLAKARGW